MRTLMFSTVALIALASVAIAGEFHEAVTAGDAARVAEMLKQNPELASAPDENDQFLSPPLCLAAIAGNIEIAQLLLDAGVDVDLGDIDESTPLHVAALNRHPDMVTFLLEQGADVNRRDKNGGYALSFGASGGDPEVVRILLDAGVDLNYWNPQGFTLYHLAASRNLKPLVDALLARGDDINAATGTGVAPMHWAAIRDQGDMITYMIENGAEHSPADGDGQTPLGVAAQRGAVNAIEALLAAGADPNLADTRGHTPLQFACWTGSTEAALALLENGADPKSVDEAGQTPLACAVPEGNADLVNRLLEAGADPETSDPRYGLPVLHVAAMLGSADMVEALINKGASVNLKDADGKVAFDYAVRYGHTDVAQVLKSHGARGNIPEAFDGSLAAQGDVAEGEAVIWYLDHSGWAVKTRNNLLIFDYYVHDPDPAAPGLCNGRINCEEISGENVTVFASHEHGDHFDPQTFAWKDDLPRVTYVMGCEAEDAPPCEYMEGRATRNINGMTVTTIESNDTGVGFVVEVDGLVIMHAGDHANRHQDFSGPYCAEIDYLADRGFRPDIAFMPVSGCGFGDQVAVKMGVYYALEKLKPFVFVPMHSGGNPERYREFVTEASGEFKEVEMRAAGGRGDHFSYRDGRTS